MNQPTEYFIWVRDPSGESWHGLKPVTRERGEMLVIKYGKEYPSNHYWLEPVVQSSEKEENRNEPQ